MASNKKKSPVKQFLYDQRMGARRSIVEEMFNDYYNDRRNIYAMNFFRGIFFGFGSVIGGTVVVALVVWILSFFVQIPGIGQAAEQTQNKLQTEQRR